MRRILYCVGEGIGNVLETLPVIVTLEKRLGVKVDILLVKTSFWIPPETFPKNKVFQRNEVDKIVLKDYEGKVENIWGYIHTKGFSVLKRLKTLNKVGRQQMRLDTSEVRVYLNAAEDLGVPPDKFIYNTADYLGYNSQMESFDVVFINGYNRVNIGDRWAAKTYLHFPQVAEKLCRKGYKMCSVGFCKEYTTDTVDKTDLSLVDSLGLVKNAKFVVMNDTGLYHAAAAFRKPGIVIFTFTSVKKNHDPNFHKTVKVIKAELPCMKTCHQELRWRKCKDWKCRDIPVERILEEVPPPLRSS